MGWPDHNSFQEVDINQNEFNNDDFCWNISDRLDAKFDDTKESLWAEVHDWLLAETWEKLFYLKEELYKDACISDEEITYYREKIEEWEKQAEWIQEKVKYHMNHSEINYNDLLNATALNNSQKILELRTKREIHKSALNRIFEVWRFDIWDYLNAIENENDFLYWNFIDIFGFWEDTKSLIKERIETKLSWFTAVVRNREWVDIKTQFTPEYLEQNMDNLIHNFSLIVKLFLAIESSWWRNIPNQNGSGADGYFQLHTKNGKQLKSGWWSNSWETALKINKVVHWKWKFPWLDNIVKDMDLKNNWKMKLNKNGDTLHNPMDLSAEEQSILWITDLFSRIKWDKLQNLANMIAWSQFDAKVVYREIQHTRPDQWNTNKVLSNFMKMVAGVYWLKDLTDTSNLVASK